MKYQGLLYMNGYAAPHDNSEAISFSSIAQAKAWFRDKVDQAERYGAAYLDAEGCKGSLWLNVGEISDYPDIIMDATRQGIRVNRSP